VLQCKSIVEDIGVYRKRLSIDIHQVTVKLPTRNGVALFGGHGEGEMGGGGHRERGKDSGELVCSFMLDGNIGGGSY
jgi:hypothetical protein